LGLNADGTLEVPTSYEQTGWWSGGTLPGDRGPSVIVGHVDSANGPAVFARLSSLRAGDRFSVIRANGTTVRFEVTGTGEYPKAAFPTELVYGPVPFAGLRLITCSGAFDRSTGHYVDNYVVFARSVAA
jgi:hypothetical protein